MSESEINIISLEIIVLKGYYKRRIKPWGHVSQGLPSPMVLMTFDFGSNYVQIFKTGPSSFCDLPYLNDLR
jgi:hypothetical protein